MSSALNDSDPNQVKTSAFSQTDGWQLLFSKDGSAINNNTNGIINKMNKIHPNHSIFLNFLFIKYYLITFIQILSG